MREIFSEFETSLYIIRDCPVNCFANGPGIAAIDLRYIPVCTAVRRRRSNRVCIIHEIPHLPGTRLRIVTILIAFERVGNRCLVFFFFLFLFFFFLFFFSLERVRCTFRAEWTGRGVIRDWKLVRDETDRESIRLFVVTRLRYRRL